MRLSAQRILIDSQWQTGKTLHIHQGCVSSIQDFDPKQDMLLQGSLVPGFIDVQVNGGGGMLFNADPTLGSLVKIHKAHLAYGTTAMLPTLITDQYEVMQQASDAVTQAIDTRLPAIIGIHFEGPFLSCARKGVHKEAFIRAPSDKELALYTRNNIGKVMVTLAPESVPTDIIRDLVSQGVIVSLGHSNADYDSVCAAIEAGATSFTHLFNAMSPLTSRDPGMVGAALDANHCYAGVILDNHHVHPASCRIAVASKGINKMMLVTDAMAHVGSSNNLYPFFDTEIQRDNGKLTTPDGTLAGSCLSMIEAVDNACHQLNLSLSDGIAMASSSPADFLGINQKGIIALGAEADLLLLSEKRQVQQAYIGGELLYSAINKMRD
jgi:N-acetylglucosamine-6-phosphate deacetylase